jgi:hypothetical protein
MPIFRTAQTSNFTILNNAIANDETLSGAATAALIYLITKPPHWQFNARDVKRRLGVGMNKVYRIMRELIQAGYASYQRIQSGTIWNIYDTKQGSETATAPESIDRVNSERVQNERVLERTDLIERKKQQPAAVIAPISTTPMVNIPVVVSLEKDDLNYPAQLSVEEKIIVKSIIKKVKVPEMAHEVLFALAYAITNGNIQSSLGGYVTRLVVAANEGRLTRAKSTAILTASNRGVEQTQIKLALDRNIERSSDSVIKAGVAGLKAALR